MELLPKILQNPTAQEASQPDSWFKRIANALFQDYALQLNGHRIYPIEIEFYFHHPMHHADPYVHRNAIQQEMGLWYLHRQGKSFRNGSFKGLDLTFGGYPAYGGILLRTLQTEEGQLIHGPSKCVDFLMETLGCPTLGILDQQIGQRSSFDPQNKLCWEKLTDPLPQKILATPRFGLTLNRSNENPTMLNYLYSFYRFVRQDVPLKKGNPQLILALHQQGVSLLEIAAISRSRKSVIESYLQAFQNGLNESPITAESLQHEGPDLLTKSPIHYFYLYGRTLPRT